MPFQSTALRLLLLGMTVSLGCQDPSPYQFAPISGVVTLDGEPLANAFVNFQPNGGPGSTATTDQEGKYSLTTINGEIGAVVGVHTVAIYSVHSQEAPKTDTDTQGGQKERVPMRFNYRTELTLEVLPEGTDKANWELSGN
jgi:hypothetical protein